MRMMYGTRRDASAISTTRRSRWLASTESRTRSSLRAAPRPPGHISFRSIGPRPRWTPQEVAHAAHPTVAAVRLLDSGSTAVYGAAREERNPARRADGCLDLAIVRGRRPAAVDLRAGPDGRPATRSRVHTDLDGGGVPRRDERQGAGRRELAGRPFPGLRPAQRLRDAAELSLRTARAGHRGSVARARHGLRRRQPRARTGRGHHAAQLALGDRGLGPGLRPDRAGPDQRDQAAAD